MTLLSEDHPQLTLFLQIEKLKDPEAYFWNLYVSPDGTEPPRDPMKRTFTIEGTVEGLEKALQEYPCDNVNVFTPTGFPDATTSLITAVFEKKALEKQSALQQA